MTFNNKWKGGKGPPREKFEAHAKEVLGQIHYCS